MKKIRTFRCPNPECRVDGEPVEFSVTIKARNGAEETSQEEEDWLWEINACPVCAYRKLVSVEGR